MSADAKGRRWSKRAFQRRSSEVEVRLHHASLPGSQGHSCVDGSKSPTSSRRRSSSIAVTRPTPDLHRSLARKSRARESIAGVIRRSISGSTDGRDFEISRAETKNVRALDLFNALI